MGIGSIGELLAHVPHGYRDPGDVALAAELKTGEEATLLLQVKGARLRPTRRRGLRIVEADAKDAADIAAELQRKCAQLGAAVSPSSGDAPQLTCCSGATGASSW